MMKPIVLWLLTTAIVISATAAGAQPAGKVPRIGYLTNDSLAVDLPRREALRQGLRELGYIEGQTLVVEYRTADGQADKIAAFAAELAGLKVDMIFAFTALAVQAAKREMPNTPIVGITPDPLAAGLVASLARPGGNVTGFATLAGPEMYGKYLELINETVPKLTRVAFLSNATNPLRPFALKETESAARAFKISLQILDASTPETLDAVFAAATKQRAGALIVLQDAMFVAQRKRMAELAVKSRLPAIYGILEDADAGGLMAYAANRTDIFRRSATYVDKILKGTKPADLPVEQPKKFEFIINLKAAKQIGLTIPSNVLARADKVIR